MPPVIISQVKIFQSIFFEIAVLNMSTSYTHKYRFDIYKGRSNNFILIYE